MSIQVLRDEQFEKTYEVVLSPEAIQQGQEAWIVANAKDMKIDGFRPGKAPMKVLLANYGPTAKKEAVNKMLADQNKALRDAHKLTNATLVNIDNSGADDKGEKYIFSYEVPPEFELVDPKTMIVDNLTIVLDDAFIDKAVIQVRREEGNVTNHESEENYVIQDGDIVTYKLDINEGDQAIEAAKQIATNVTVGMEEHAGYQLIGDKIKGHKIGDVVTINDVQMKDLSGAWAYINDKKVTMIVTIETLTSVEMAALDDALLEKFETKTLDGLKEKLRMILSSQYTGQIELCHKRYIFDVLDKMYDFDVSTKSVEAEYDRVWKQFQDELKDFEEKGEAHPDMKDKKLDEVKADYMKVAERRVRLTHILTKAASTYKLNLTENDVAHYANIHIRPVYPRAIDLWAWRMREYEDFRNEQIAIIHENKVAQYLHSQATLTDIPVTIDQLSARMKDIMPE